MERVLGEKELVEEARKFAKKLHPQEAATIIALSGDLGVGKTTFTQALARALGVTDTITSPTFVIEKVYALTNNLFTHLIHIDAYRLSGTEELSQLGWDTYVKNPNNIIVVEWAERIKDALPQNTIHINLAHNNKTTRTVSYDS